MKIHTYVRDAKRMKLNELEAINRKVVEVQANVTEDGGNDSKKEEAQEENASKARKKKNKENV